jgi:hypothetical protein
MPPKSHFRAVLVFFFCCLAFLLPVSGQKPKLTRAKVEQLIQIKAPDELIASQIRSVGLGFPVSRKVVDELAAKGAKPLTLAALRERIILGKGKIDVQSEPGSKLILDGKEVGIASANGSFVLQDVVEGDHALAVRLEGYRDAVTKFSLDNNEVKTLSLPMEFLGGVLTITAQPASARIQVAGPRSFEGSLTEGKLPLGLYKATILLDGYTTQTRNFWITAGEHHVEQFQLAIDLVAVKAKADAGDDASLEMLIQAIERGEQVVCNVRTGGWDYMGGTGPFVVDGTVTVSKTSISYRRTYGGDRSQPDFTVFPDKILLLAFENTLPVSVHLKVAIVNKKGTKDNKFDFRFYNPSAAVVDTTGRQGYMYTRGIACDGCDSSLVVLNRLLLKVRGGN